MEADRASRLSGEDAGHGGPAGGQPRSARRSRARWRGLQAADRVVPVWSGDVVHEQRVVGAVVGVPAGFGVWSGEVEVRGVVCTGGRFGRAEHALEHLWVVTPQVHRPTVEGGQDASRVRTVPRKTGPVPDRRWSLVRLLDGQPEVACQVPKEVGGLDVGANGNQASWPNQELSPPAVTVVVPAHEVVAALDDLSSLRIRDSAGLSRGDSIGACCPVLQGPSSLRI